jgi:hypothetical protein
MKQMVFTGYSPELAELADIVEPNHRRYAIRHGYDFYIHHNIWPEWDLSRFRILRDLLGVMDLILMIDIDAVIMRSDIRFESFISDEYDQVIAEERIGGCTINGGVMIFRKAQSSIDLLNWWIDNHDEHKKVPLRGQQYLAERLWKHDTTLLRMKVVDPHPFHSCPQLLTGSTYQEGDFVVHFMGADLVNKIRLAKEWVPKCK